MKQPRALVFDVFGTVVNWRSSIAAEMAVFGQTRGLSCDWYGFADAWRAGYDPGMEPIRSGARPWVNLDVIHRERLEELLVAFDLPALSETEKARLTDAWHRLDPWPDSVAGLTRLKAGHIIATLSNGSVLCLAGMAKRAGLPWDCILSADLVHQYKPRPETYRLAIEVFGPDPATVMMVAAHNSDLRHARSHGMATAFIRRPREHGPDQSVDLAAEEDWDFAVDSIEELADAMGV
ncbi:MAG: haloacid dehalogenase type II [bacterium]|nr:haloacid dehalogenase type II [bacterium]